MLLHFERFDVQDSSNCSNDSVSLTDTATGIELFKLCGHQLPDDVMSSSNEMTVGFKTDGSVTTNGFAISYQASSEVYGKPHIVSSFCANVAMCLYDNEALIFYRSVVGDILRLSNGL